jgi:hypothetical protein
LVLKAGYKISEIGKLTLREISILCEQYGKINMQELALNNIGRAQASQVAGASISSNRNRQAFNQFLNFQKDILNGNSNEELDKNKIKKYLENRFGVKI